MCIPVFPISQFNETMYLLHIRQLVANTFCYPNLQKQKESYFIVFLQNRDISKVNQLVSQYVHIFLPPYLPTYNGKLAASSNVLILKESKCEYLCIKTLNEGTFYMAIAFILGSYPIAASVLNTVGFHFIYVTYFYEGSYLNFYSFYLFTTFIYCPSHILWLWAVYSIKVLKH